MDYRYIALAFLIGLVAVGTGMFAMTDSEPDISVQFDETPHLVLDSGSLELGYETVVQRTEIDSEAAAFDGIYADKVYYKAYTDTTTVTRSYDPDTDTIETAPFTKIYQGLTNTSTTYYGDFDVMSGTYNVLYKDGSDAIIRDLATGDEKTLVSDISSIDATASKGYVTTDSGSVQTYPYTDSEQSKPLTDVDNDGVDEQINSTSQQSFTLDDGTEFNASGYLTYGNVLYYMKDPDPNDNIIESVGLYKYGPTTQLYESGTFSTSYDFNTTKNVTTVTVTGQGDGITTTINGESFTGTGTFDVKQVVDSLDVSITLEKTNGTSPVVDGVGLDYTTYNPDDGTDDNTNNTDDGTDSPTGAIGAREGSAILGLVAVVVIGYVLVRK